MGSFLIATQGIAGGPLAVATLGFEGGEAASVDITLTGQQTSGDVGVIGLVVSNGAVLVGAAAATTRLGELGWTSSEGTAQLGPVAAAATAGQVRTNGALGRSGVVIWGDFSASRAAGKTAHTGTMIFRRAA